MALPNFIIPGAEKAGTTPLFRLLEQHPDIHIPIQKELHFFTRNFDRREPAFYEWQFARGYHGQRAVGEASPEYMRFPGVAQRMRALLGPDLRLIFCLRNPVTRAFSHYLQCIRMMEETESFERALELEPQRGRQRRFLNLRRAYIGGGLYSEQIERFLEHFPIDQMRFLVLEEDLQGPKRQRDRVLVELLKFLGVDSSFAFNQKIEDTRLPPPDVFFVGKGDNIRVPGTKQRAAAGSIVMDAHVKGAHRYIVNPSPLARRHFARIRQRMTRKLAPETAARLYDEHFRAEIDRTEALIGRDLSVWRAE